MSHIWTSHVTHIERVMSCIRTSHVACMNESCRMYERVMSHVWTSHVVHTNESCRMYERVMLHIANESSRAYERVMYVTYMTYMTHVCDMICMTWLVTSYIHRKSSLYLPLGSVNLVLKRHVCDMICTTWLVTSCMWQSHVWTSHVVHMDDSCMWHDMYDLTRDLIYS